MIDSLISAVGPVDAAVFLALCLTTIPAYMLVFLTAARLAYDDLTSENSEENVATFDPTQ